MSPPVFPIETFIGFVFIRRVKSLLGIFTHDGGYFIQQYPILPFNFSEPNLLLQLFLPIINMYFPIVHGGSPRPDPIQIIEMTFH